MIGKFPTQNNTKLTYVLYAIPVIGRMGRRPLFVTKLYFFLAAKRASWSCERKVIILYTRKELLHLNLKICM